jgi:superoxide reductase
MNDRRDLLKTTAVAATLIAFGSTRRATASGKDRYTNVVFTKENPGRWKGKENIHVPQVTITGSKIVVFTDHPMSQAHYIVRHTVELADGTPVGARTFTPSDKPESSYELPKGYKGKFFVTSFCNLHDFWLAEAKA